MFISINGQSRSMEYLFSFIIPPSILISTQTMDVSDPKHIVFGN